MLALSLDAAKHIAVSVVVVLVALALVSAAAIKSVVAKLITVLLLGGLALGVWTQRSNLVDCAQQVKDRGVADTAVRCTLFGTTVDVPNVPSVPSVPTTDPAG